MMGTPEWRKKEILGVVERQSNTSHGWAMTTMVEQRQCQRILVRGSEKDHIHTQQWTHTHFLWQGRRWNHRGLFCFLLSCTSCWPLWCHALKRTSKCIQWTQTRGAIARLTRSASQATTPYEAVEHNKLTTCYYMQRLGLNMHTYTVPCTH